MQDEGISDPRVLAAPLGDEGQQQSTVVHSQKGRPIAGANFPCRFVRLVGQEGWAEDASATTRDRGVVPTDDRAPSGGVVPAVGAP
jgi:hypothetical protein